MCSKDKPLYPKHTIFRNTHHVHYRIGRNEPKGNLNNLEFFAIIKNKWMNYGKTYGTAPNYILKYIEPVTPQPTEPYSCSKCQNKGCDNCKRIPWSVYNVFTR